MWFFLGGGFVYWAMLWGSGFSVCRGLVFPRPPLRALGSHSPDHCGIQLSGVQEDAVERGSQAALP